MSAPRGTAARVAALEAEVAGQQEQVRALSGQIAALGDALAAAARHAGVSLPAPRHLRAVEDARDGAR